MNEIIEGATDIIGLGFAFIPSTWFAVVLPAAALVGIIVAIRRL